MEQFRLDIRFQRPKIAFRKIRNSLQFSQIPSTSNFSFLWACVIKNNETLLFSSSNCFKFNTSILNILYINSYYTYCIISMSHLISTSSSYTDNERKI